MTKRCTFQVPMSHRPEDGMMNCGSYAFNLLVDGINQGDFCDKHYWQDRADHWRAMAERLSLELRGCVQQMATYGNALNTYAENLDRCNEQEDAAATIAALRPEFIAPFKKR